MLMTALAVAVLQQVLPAGPLVSGGLADPREPRNALSWITTTLFADPLVDRPNQGFPPGTDLKHDAQGLVELGTNLPLLRTGPVAFSLQGGMISRFRLEARDNDLLSTDYMIALPLNYRSGAYSARIRLLHRSGHLGDELEQNTTIRRIEYTHQEADALLARSFGAWRAYAGGAVTISSYFPDDKGGVQVGADGEWRLTRPLSVLAGVDWQKHAITRGNAALAATAGLQVRGRGGRAALVGRFLSGATPIGEFFLERERYWGVSLVLSRSEGTGNLRGPP